MSRPEDLEETERLVKDLGRRVVTYQTDVRDPAAVRSAVDNGVSELGRLDVVVANAGLCTGFDLQAFTDVVNVNLVGSINVIHSSLPYLQEGASIIATGSLAAFLPGATDNPDSGAGSHGYTFAKKALAAFVHTFSLELAPRKIRLNAVHPTNCNTALLHNDQMYQAFDRTWRRRRGPMRRSRSQPCRR